MLYPCYRLQTGDFELTHKENDEQAAEDFIQTIYEQAEVFSDNCFDMEHQANCGLGTKKGKEDKVVSIYEQAKNDSSPFEPSFIKDGDIDPTDIRQVFFFVLNK